MIWLVLPIPKAPINYIDIVNNWNSPILHFGQDVFEELLIEDNKLLKELDKTGKNHQKILDIFAKRVSLHKDWFEKEFLFNIIGF